jgi:hypothetical protein
MRKDANYFACVCVDCRHIYLHPVNRPLTDLTAKGWWFDGTYWHCFWCSCSEVEPLPLISLLLG